MAAAPTMSTWAVVVAGGTGTRYGGLKQLASLGDRRVIEWSIDSLRPVCAGMVVVVPPGYTSEVDPTGLDAVVEGGATRSDSVRVGLDAVAATCTHVLVHDAARPLATTSVAQRVVDALADGEVAAVPVVPVTDSLRTVDGNPVDRSAYLAVQTPQGFDVDVLRRAHRSAEVATDDATLVDRLGHRVAHVEGEPVNLKITEPHDLRIAETLLAEIKPRQESRVMELESLRIGHGFDVHPFADDGDRPLVLGGVTFAGEVGLAGHSDADVIAHACTDALLGAAGLGDIGTLFPDTESSLAGADSVAMLVGAVGTLVASGWRPLNVDCTVVLDRPKIAPHRDRMERILSGAVGAPVTIKGKRTEGMTELAGGIRCFALALVART
ncbi:MAG: 2-C-methyl-D-erythritol 2,4-cyclodiphosphate synthase [Acidimicrobiia bacterium]|nr:2-C-methyl-D-erythritol 2,4-cyclodiphosphate synthase [Acidimicrobiia bacterium]